MSDKRSLHTKPVTQPEHIPFDFIQLPGDVENATTVVESEDAGVIEEVAIRSDIKPGPTSAKTAQRFVDLMKTGYTPGEAARMAGRTSVRALMQDTGARKTVRALAEEYGMNDDVRKILVKFGLNKIAIDNLSKEDRDSQKLALDALKAIATDPDVGLNAAQANIGIAINLGDLGALLEKVPELPKDLIVADNNNENESD